MEFITQNGKVINAPDRTKEEFTGTDCKLLAVSDRFLYYGAEKEEIFVTKRFNGEQATNIETFFMSSLTEDMEKNDILYINKDLKAYVMENYEVDKEDDIER